jgi:hypothetical protein
MLNFTKKDGGMCDAAPETILGIRVRQFSIKIFSRDTNLPRPCLLEKTIMELASSLPLGKEICRILKDDRQLGGMRQGPSSVWFGSSVNNPTGKAFTPPQLSTFRFLSNGRSGVVTIVSL